MEGDVCRLGGYENTLLGYRSRVCEEWSEVDSEDLDVIMFGELYNSRDIYLQICTQTINHVI